MARNCQELDLGRNSRTSESLARRVSTETKFTPPTLTGVLLSPQNEQRTSLRIAVISRSDLLGIPKSGGGPSRSRAGGNFGMRL